MNVFTRCAADHAGPWAEGDDLNESQCAGRSEELAALHAVASAANQSLELGQVLRLSLEKAVEVTCASNGALYLLDKGGRTLELQVWRGQSAGRPPERLPVSEGGLNVEALRKKRLVYCDDYGRYPGALPGLAEGLAGMAFVAVPLLSKGRPLGTLILGRPVGLSFSAAERSVLESMGFQIGLAIGNAQLFKSLKEMARREVELESANERLRAIDEMKNTLLANVSHELRTPLVPIGGFTRMVYDEKVGELNPKQREFLGIVLRNVERLGQLIENLLNFSSLRPGTARVAVESFDLAGCVRSVLKTFEPVAAASNVRLESVLPEGELQVRADPAKITQVLDNLVGNAIKFNRPGGRAMVHVVPMDGDFEIQVEDTGRGIAERDLPHIFERFYKADVFSKGTGLGLALVKQILLLHGKDIWVESRLGEGSRFSFRLSRAAEFRPREVRAAAKTVLVVDDEPDTVQFERTLLEQEGFRVVAAASGQEALAALGREPVDLVLLDLKMPGMDGIEVCRRIKGDPLLKKVNVQVVTARSDEPMVKLSYQAGADGYIVKPFDLETFMDRVSSILL
jgi:signal transduction histidine kinase/CheY-like chemotaxis protein